MMSWIAAVLVATLLPQEVETPTPTKRPTPTPTPTVVLADQGGQRPSGPRTGAALESLKVFELGRGDVDLRADIGQRSAILCFVQVLDRNVAPILRGLDDIDRERALGDLVVRCILISGDRSEGERRLAAVNGSLRMRSPLVLSTDGAEGPGAYALDKDCRATLVFVRDAKVVRSTGLLDPGRQDIAWIRDEVQKLDGPLPKNEEEWLAKLETKMPSDVGTLRRELVKAWVAGRRLEERVAQLEADLRRAHNQAARAPRGERMAGERMPPERMQGERMQGERTPGERTQGERTPGERTQGVTPAEGEARAALKREGAPPKDEQLKTELRAFIAKTNDAATTDRVYERIVERAAMSADLQGEAREMFRLVLSLGYGSERARHLAQSYVDGKRPEKRGAGR